MEEIRRNPRGESSEKISWTYNLRGCRKISNSGTLHPRLRGQAKEAGDGERSWRTGDERGFPCFARCSIGGRGARVKLIRVEKKKRKVARNETWEARHRLEIRLIGNVVEDLEESEREGERIKI